MNFLYVPLIQRESWDREVHQTIFETTISYTEYQLLAHHMAPMFIGMGTNVRAILYQHALSRAGLNPSPLRDALTNLEPIIDEVIEHAWLDRADFVRIKDYIVGCGWLRGVPWRLATVHIRGTASHSIR